MAIKLYKPTTSARRHASVMLRDNVDKVEPHKALLMKRGGNAGRNNTGKITVRHQGGGEKQKIRLVDFMGDKFDIPGRVQTVEYDPNRNANIALVFYADGEKRYVIAPLELKSGDTIVSSKTNFQFKIGNRFPLSLIPPGTFVHNVEIEPGKGGKMARSAGNSIVLMVVEGERAQLKMPSGEIRMVPKECLATIGQVSNPEYRNIRWGKAGRMRHRGIRPSVRGKVMNPVDHPHGGGEGKNPIGLRKGPMNVYGKKALGVKTRKVNRASSRLILRRRNK